MTLLLVDFSKHANIRIDMQVKLSFLTVVFAYYIEK